MSNGTLGMDAQQGIDMQINVTDEQRAVIYRELAEALPDWEGSEALTSWIIEQADELESPEERWLRSLPEVGNLTNGADAYFDLALHNLRMALLKEKFADSGGMIQHSQMAAALIVAWRKILPEPTTGSAGLAPYIDMNDRELLRDAVRCLLDADALTTLDEPRRVSGRLHNAEHALRLLWERNR